MGNFPWRFATICKEDGTVFLRGLCFLGIPRICREVSLNFLSSSKDFQERFLYCLRLPGNFLARLMSELRSWSNVLGRLRPSMRRGARGDTYSMQLFCLQLCLGTLGAASCLQFELFCLQLSFFAYNLKVRLRSTSTGCKQRSSTVSKTGSNCK